MEQLILPHIIVKVLPNYSGDRVIKLSAITDRANINNSADVKWLLERVDELAVSLEKHLRASCIASTSCSATKALANLYDTEEN